MRADAFLRCIVYAYPLKQQQTIRVQTAGSRDACIAKYCLHSLQTRTVSRCAAGAVAPKYERGTLEEQHEPQNCCPQCLQYTRFRKNENTVLHSGPAHIRTFFFRCSSSTAPLPPLLLLLPPLPFVPPPDPSNSSALPLLRRLMLSLVSRWTQPRSSSSGEICPEDFGCL